MEDGIFSPPSHNSSSHFLYKAILLSIFLLFVPLFDFSSTPTWGKELLQLVFVGIAVSYGLFSTKRNHVSPPPSPPHKQDDAQSYVAPGLFESSSLFDHDHDHDHDHDDDFEIPSASLSSHETSSKVWNSQYYRGEPIVVVANKESSDEDSIVGGRQENNIGVLRSPVPWRSRSGRNMEVNTPAAAASPSNPPAPSVSEIRSKSFQDFGRSSRKKTTIPPPPPPPPPLPLNRNNRKEFTRNYNNRSSRRGTALSKPNQENYLSHDHEIESFIETRGGGKFIIPNPKQEEEEEDNKKKKKEITDTESEYDDDDHLASKTSNANGPDVDKKADEFIAKFREQIRLQRIASIRTSTQIHKNNIY